MKGVVLWRLDAGYGVIGTDHTGNYFFVDADVAKPPPRGADWAKKVVTFQPSTCTRGTGATYKLAIAIEFGAKIPNKELRKASPMRFEARDLSGVVACVMTRPQLARPAAPSTAPVVSSTPAKPPKNDLPAPRRIDLPARQGDVRNTNYTWCPADIHKHIARYLVDEWIDELFPAVVARGGILVTGYVLQGGKGDVAATVKLATAIAVRFPAADVAIVTLPDNDQTGITKQPATHEAFARSMCGSPKVAVLTSGLGGLTVARAAGTTPLAAYTSPILVVNVLDSDLYDKRLRAQLVAPPTAVFEVMEAGLVPKRIDDPFASRRLGLGVSPVERGLLPGAPPPPSASVASLSGNPANAGLGLKNELTGGPGRLYYGYAHMERYLQMYLQTVLMLELGQTANFDVCMYTTCLQPTPTTKRTDIAPSLGTLLAQARQEGVLGDGDEVVLVRGLGANATRVATTLLASKVARTRAIRIIDPYSKEHDWGARTTENLNEAAGLSLDDMAVLGAISQPFCVATGENSVTEQACIDKRWCYEVFSFKQSVFDDMTKVASSVSSDVEAFLRNAKAAATKGVDRVSCTPLANALKKGSFDSEFTSFNKAWLERAGFGNGRNGLDQVLKRVNRLLFHHDLRQASCAACKAEQSLLDLEERALAHVSSLDDLADPTPRAELELLLGSIAEMVDQQKPAEVHAPALRWKAIPDEGVTIE